MHKQRLAVRARYEADLRNFHVAASRAGALTAIVLLLAGGALDYVIYPRELARFLIARVMASVAVGMVCLLLRKRVGKHAISLLTTVWLLVPQVMVAWMIHATDGAASIYYAGLNLAIFAVGIVLPMGVWQTAAFGLTTYLLYSLACATHPDWATQGSYFLVNSLFILFATIASAVYTLVNQRGRVRLFQMKEKVARTNRDLTRSHHNLVRIKGQLLQQEKMATIGTLTAGLLHEVNNPVNFSLMAIEVAMEEPLVRQHPLLEECLRDVRDGLQRIQYIVSDLKTFAYRNPQGDPGGSPFILEKAIDSAVRLASHELRGVRLTRHVPDDSLVFGDYAAIIGVLINLFSNAAHAMTKAGTATPQLHTNVKSVGGRLEITVRDNGPGIPPENLDRVFEPFFTTREVGQGLGLGLSISYAVVERHGGKLIVDSEPGCWTVFSFDLPRAT